MVTDGAAAEVGSVGEVEVRGSMSSYAASPPDADGPCNRKERTFRSEGAYTSSLLAWRVRTRRRRRLGRRGNRLVRECHQVLEDLDSHFVLLGDYRSPSRSSSDFPLRVGGTRGSRRPGCNSPGVLGWTRLSGPHLPKRVNGSSRTG